MFKSRVADYLLSIDGPFDDGQLELLETNGGWVAGGCISALLTGREIRDVDVYFPSLIAALDFAEAAENGRIIGSSTRSLIYAPRPNAHPIQLIFDRFYKSAEDIFAAFDFTACMGAWDFAQKRLVLHEDFLDANMHRELRFHPGTLYPMVTYLLRIDKYLEYGYKISNLERLKILTAIGQLNLQTLGDLKDQIGGMYGSVIELDHVTSIEDFYKASMSNLHFTNKNPVSGDPALRMAEYHIPQLKNLSISVGTTQPQRDIATYVYHSRQHDPVCIIHKDYERTLVNKHLLREKGWMRVDEQEIDFSWKSGSSVCSVEIWNKLPLKKRIALVLEVNVDESVKVGQLWNKALLDE